MNKNEYVGSLVVCGRRYGSQLLGMIMQYNSIDDAYLIHFFYNIKYHISLVEDGGIVCSWYDGPCTRRWHELFKEKYP